MPATFPHSIVADTQRLHPLRRPYRYGDDVYRPIESSARATNEGGRCRGKGMPEPGVPTSVLPTSLRVARGSRCTDVPSMTVSTHGLLVIATPPRGPIPPRPPRRISLSRAHSSTALRQISHQVKFSQHGSDATRQRKRGIYKRGQMQLGD